MKKLLMAMLGLVGFTVLMLEGLKRTAAVDAGIIAATLPAVVAALGALFAGERLSRLQATAVGLAVAGLSRRVPPLHSIWVNVWAPPGSPERCWSSAASCWVRSVPQFHAVDDAARPSGAAPHIDRACC